MTYVVAVYEIDRAYGGSEEGGWWFDCGEIHHVAKTFKSEKKAKDFERRYNHLLDILVKPKIPLDSISYRGGTYQARSYKNVAPSYYPERRPTYE
jgi:hypothetical protein